MNAAEARIRVLRILLESLNWYGMVVDYPLIHSVLSSWKRTKAHQDGPRFYNNFQEFYNNYPFEPEREEAEAQLTDRWRNVIANLERIEEQLNVDEQAVRNKGQKLEQDIHVCRGLLKYCMAEAVSEWQEPGRDDEARALFHKACTLQENWIGIDEEEDNPLEFTVSYVYVDLFRYHFQRHEHPEALAALRKACERRDPTDREIEARLLNAFADVFFQSGDTDNAILACYGAMLQAYLFLYTQDYLLDSYSRVFYRLICGHVFRRLREQNTSWEDLLRNCRSLRREWDRVHQILDRHPGLPLEPPLRAMRAWDDTEADHLLRAEPNEDERSGMGGFYGLLTPILDRQGWDITNNA